VKSCCLPVYTFEWGYAHHHYFDNLLFQQNHQTPVQLLQVLERVDLKKREYVAFYKDAILRKLFEYDRSYNKVKYIALMYYVKLEFSRR